MSHRSRLLCILSLLLFSASARSQQPAIEVKQKPEVAAVQQKALKLLESLASDVSNLRSAENRARIGSNIAELLWDHDEKRARSLFAAAEQDLRTGFTNIDVEAPPGDDSLRVLAFLRSNIVTRIAKHDPELALEFLRSTRPALYTKIPDYMKGMDKAIELQLAGQVAAKNPQLALKLARQSLAKGLSNELLPALIQIRQKDKDAALSFYSEIVDKLKSTNLTQEGEALSFALSLVRLFPPPAADEQSFRELVGVLLGSAFANGCANAEAESAQGYFCAQIGSIFPLMEKYYPSRAAGLRRWAVDEQSADYSDFRMLSESFEQETLDEVLAQALKYPQMHDRIYWLAMRKAIASGDLQKARQIAADTQNEEQRTYMLKELEGEENWQAITAEKLTEVQHYVNGIPIGYQRVLYLLAVASKIGGNNRKAALGILDQVAQMLDSGKPGAEQIVGQIQLAKSYCSLKSDRGFVIMESVIPKLNELVAAAAVLDRFENEYLRDAEWSMTGQGLLGGLLTDLAQSAGFFAWYDFDRSVNLAGQFERPEVRLMAQSKVAQAIMEGQSKEGPVSRGMFEYNRY